MQNPYYSESNKPEENEHLTASVLLEKERWSPYQGLLVFSSTVLLWHRPVVFAVFAIFTHLILWYTSVAIIKWNVWLVVGILLSLGFTIDFLCGLFDITWDKCLSFFPLDGNEKYSYQEIIQQYVSLKKYIRQQYQKAMQFRQEQPQQFLITSLFFTLVACFCLSLVSLFTVVYISVFITLLAPGLWHNDIPRRVSVALMPYIATGYGIAHEKLSNVINPANKPNSSPSSSIRPMSQQSNLSGEQRRARPVSTRVNPSNPQYNTMPSRPMSTNYSDYNMSPTTETIPPYAADPVRPSRRRYQ